jgi:hypothetical protein
MILKYMCMKEDLVVWQLRVFGEHLDRSMDSAWDPRVTFLPDAWQRKVLDCLDDKGHSVLVVGMCPVYPHSTSIRRANRRAAPTSAGKTFISYYAMEKVLRASNDGILVYIAPTKALVAQIAAEVYARFSKTLAAGLLVLRLQQAVADAAQDRAGPCTLGITVSMIRRSVRSSSRSRKSSRSCCCLRRWRKSGRRG